MMNLKFRPRDVAKFEKETGLSIFDILDPSIQNLVTLIQLGKKGITEDDAYDILEQELEKEDVDTITVLQHIMEALQKYGFLPNKQRFPLEIFIKKIEKSFEAMIQEIEGEEIVLPTQQETPQVVYHQEPLPQKQEMEEL